MAQNQAKTCFSDGSWLKTEAPSLCDTCSKQKLSTCSIIKPDVSEKLRVLMTRQAFAENEVIFEEHTPTDKVYVIVSGLVRRVKYMQSGRRYVAAFVGQGDMMGVVSKQSHEFAAECVTPTEVCSFTRAVFDSVLQSDPELGQRIYGAVSNELIETHIHSLVLAHDAAKARIAAFFQIMRAKDYRRTGQSAYIDLAMKRQDIADYVGLAHETVSRAIHQLTADGAIRLEGHYRVWINDIDDLTEISDDVLYDMEAISA